MNDVTRSHLHRLRFSQARFSVASLAGLLALSSGLKAQDDSSSGRRPSQREDLPADTERRPSPFLIFDTNHDGIVSSDEINAAASLLRGFDKNKDGKLTGDELRPPRPRRPRDDEGEGADGGMPPPSR